MNILAGGQGGSGQIGFRGQIGKQMDVGARFGTGRLRSNGSRGHIWAHRVGPDRSRG